jgi:hypothetical protein
MKGSTSIIGTAAEKTSEMRTRRGGKGASRRALPVLAMALFAASFGTPVAAASFLAQHFGLSPVGGEPLRSGFAEVIHPEGPNIYARHVYQPNGARSDETYHVWVHIWTADFTCSGVTPYHLPVAELFTNTAGNGHADVVHTPEDLALLGLGDQAIGGEVTIELGGVVAYTTGCAVIQLD